MSSEERASRPFAVYAVAIGLFGATSMGLSWLVIPPTNIAYLALVAAAAVAAEAMAVTLPGGGSASLSYPLSVAATALMGPTAGGVVAGLSGVNYDDVIRRRPIAVYLFNIGQVVLCSVASGWAYVLLGGRTLLAGSGARYAAEDFHRIVPAVIALVLVSLLLNTVLTVFAVALLRRVPMRVVWRGSFSWALPMQAVLGVLGVAIAQVLALAPAAFALFVFPLIVARQLYRRYSGLKDAYLDTVRSLVAAIEAKDPYTRGHSERVADYAIRLARASGMQDERLERLEFAALLHDLGKVGIRSSVLGKPGGLTHDEFDEIKRHPAIGARILERVPYLEDIVPAVYSHHERFDGGGYGEGLASSQVPLEARILAVADSFDAMTSRRPYRPALSHAEAVRELKLHAGDQFDPVLVDEFLSMMGEEPIAQKPSSPLMVSEAVVRDA